MPDSESDHNPDRLYVGWHPNLYDGQDHAVTDEAFTSRRGRTAGGLDAVCGAPVCLASSFAPPGRACPRCLEFLAARASLDHRVGRAKIRQRWLRWIGRLFRPPPSPAR